MSNILEIHNVSKQYRLGTVGTGTLSHDLNRWWYKVRGKEDPYLKIGATNDRSAKADSEYVWALKDISFNVQQGEVLGIIGKNGAGKSTLLKILSKVTGPTTGSIKAYGRIASLLEVGTGFHPELTGRENIFLNGAIMGMSKTEIRSKFDEIVDFSGVEKYIDTPVKRYSSGMYVRLAFAVAAHLEPEILIVDEVLAVGDAEFQKKALGKMKDVSQGQGRTVLFVSHNMGAVEQLCSKALLIKNGSLFMSGVCSDVIKKYISNSSITSNVFHNEKPKDDSDIISISVKNINNENTSVFKFNEEIKIVYELKIALIHSEALLGIRIKDNRERNIFTSQCKIKDIVKNPGIHTIEVVIPSCFLVPNKYSVISGFHIVNQEVISVLENISFQIEETGTDFYQYAGNDYGCVFVDCKWNKG